MPNIDDIYAGGFIKPDNLDALALRNKRLTMLDCVEEVAFKKKRLVLSFVETKATLTLNKTQAGAIGAKHGKLSESWRGKAITLDVGETEYQGQKKPTIVVTPVD